MAADPTRLRFEVDLTPEDTAIVVAAMTAAGITSRAKYLRACLLADRAGDGAALATALGAFGIILNELRLQQRDASAKVPTPGATPVCGLPADLDQAIQRLLAQGERAYRAVLRDLRTGGG